MKQSLFRANCASIMARLAFSLVFTITASVVFAGGFFDQQRERLEDSVSNETQNLEKSIRGAFEQHGCSAFVGGKFGNLNYHATVKAIQQNKSRLQEEGINSEGSCKQKTGQVAAVIAPEVGVPQAALAGTWVSCACEDAY